MVKILVLGEYTLTVEESLKTKFGDIKVHNLNGILSLHHDVLDEASACNIIAFGEGICSITYDDVISVANGKPVFTPVICDDTISDWILINTVDDKYKDYVPKGTTVVLYEYGKKLTTLDDGNKDTVMGKQYDIVLKQKESEDGLTVEEIIEISKKVNDSVYFVADIPAKDHECHAIGLVSQSAVEEHEYFYEDSKFMDFIASILDDMNNETETGEYEYTDNIHVLMTY